MLVRGSKADSRVAERHHEGDESVLAFQAERSCMAPLRNWAQSPKGGVELGWECSASFSMGEFSPPALLSRASRSAAPARSKVLAYP